MDEREDGSVPAAPDAENEVGGARDGPVYGRARAGSPAVPPPGWDPESSAGSAAPAAAESAVWTYPGAGQTPWGEPIPPRDGPAWEWRRELGTVRAAWLTVREIFTSPDQAFSRAIRDGGLGAPFQFYILMGYVFGILGFVISWPIQLLAERVMGGMFPGTSGGVAAEWPPFMRFLDNGSSFGVALLIQIVLLPFTLTAILFVGSAILHVFLKLLGGGRAGFEASFRAVAYAQGSVTPFQIVPFVGPMVAMVLGIIFLIIGLARMHETATWRAVLAVLLPFMLITVFAVLAAVVVILALYGGARGF
ncbi:MAG TPA: YIP1 family protein [Candidatus Sumerlaeota bacterium]|nr:YIP1 family protein [Candidatus Sumerlaeota bacterium]